MAVGDTLSFSSDNTPAPDPDDTDAEFKCSICSRALDYSGRGRKPSKCSASNNGDPECYGKRSRASSAGRVPSNDKLARQAADALVGLNAAVGAAAYFTGFQATAGAIANGNDAFGESAYNALLIDPGMCKMILRGGASSGKIALVIAYAMFLVPVSQTAASEYRMMKQLAEMKAATVE